jgi:predicted nucleic acid-binding Zn ribbon protein
MKKQNTETIGSLIPLWIEEMKLKGKLSETRVIAAWDKVVGSFIASKTREISIKDSKLVVRLDSSVVRNELAHAKPMLIARLNAEAGGDIIDDILLW